MSDGRITEFLSTLENDRRSCPHSWHDFYKYLLGLADHAGTKPPVPLILAASGESDATKLHRLGMQLEWAESVGVIEEALSYLNGLGENEWTYGSEETWFKNSYPPYGHTSDPKPKMDADSANRLIGFLNASWTSIAGPNIASSMKALYFAGRKGRRLVVFVEPGTSPPWGKFWNSLGHQDGNSFTIFRKSVNDAIKPWEVDHIEFVHTLPKGKRTLKR